MVACIRWVKLYEFEHNNLDIIDKRKCANRGTGEDDTNKLCGLRIQ